MIKKNVLLSVATITMMCFIFAGCAGGSDNDANEEKTEEKTKKESAKTTETSNKEMTEDLYVEIVAQQMYLADKYGEKAEEDMSEKEAMKLSVEMGEEMNNLYKEHGVTEDDFTQFGDKLSEDMETYGPIMERINKRTEELVAEGEE